MADPRLSNYQFRNSLAAHNPTLSLIGPFHRIRSRSQSSDDDQKQIDSGLLFGDVPFQGGKCATVPAYFGPLPATEHGIEFLTATIPYQIGLPDGFVANWYLDDTAFTGKVEYIGRTLAAISIIVVKWQK